MKTDHFSRSRFQGKLVALLMGIHFKSDQRDVIISEMNDLLLDASNRHLYLTPPIACGLHHLKLAHDSIKIDNLAELSHVCDCLEKLFEMDGNEDTKIE